MSLWPGILETNSMHLLTHQAGRFPRAGAGLTSGSPVCITMVCLLHQTGAHPLSPPSPTPQSSCLPMRDCSCHLLPLVLCALAISAPFLLGINPFLPPPDPSLAVLSAKPSPAHLSAVDSVIVTSPGCSLHTQEQIKAFSPTLPSAFPVLLRAVTLSLPGPLLG